MYAVINDERAPTTYEAMKDFELKGLHLIINPTPLYLQRITRSQ